MKRLIISSLLSLSLATPVMASKGTFRSCIDKDTCGMFNVVAVGGGDDEDGALYTVVTFASGGKRIALNFQAMCFAESGPKYISMIEGYETVYTVEFIKNKPIQKPTPLVQTMTKIFEITCQNVGR